jgi:hypothetical protein
MIKYKNSILRRFQEICTRQKDECAYGNVLEVLFSEDFMLYQQTDCLSEASYLFVDMPSIKSSEN